MDQIVRKMRNNTTMLETKLPTGYTYNYDGGKTSRKPGDIFYTHDIFHSGTNNLLD